MRYKHLALEEETTPALVNTAALIVGAPAQPQLSLLVLLQ
jgi:hypothetical protein